MWQGAVFFDYDGTLVDKERGVPAPTARTKEALSRLKENQYLKVLCTGRPMAYIPQDAKELEFDAWITTNGAYAQMDGKALFNHLLDKESVTCFMKACERLKISYTLEGQDACYYQIFSPIFQKWTERFQISTKNMYPIEQIKFWSLNKMMIVFDEEDQFLQLQREFGDRFVFDRHALFTSSDVSRKGINKGTGVKQFLAHLNLSDGQTYAIGDSDNDLEMIKFAKTGIAMGQHSPRLGRAADYITDNVANDGVAKALEHFHLVRQPLFR